ncbi:MAG: nucleotide exchange factor GrpE [bacterium]
MPTEDQTKEHTGKRHRSGGHGARDGATADHADTAGSAGITGSAGSEARDGLEPDRHREAEHLEAEHAEGHKHKPSRKEIATELERARAEAREAADKYLRVLADFDNYRKRVARENQERTRCANEDLIRRLLEVVDDMERALAASAGGTDFAGLRKGLELTYANLKEMLTREGLCAIKCIGERFDPNYHEAIMALEKEGAASDSVVDEVQRGYTLNGRVIRPSKVVVSK